MVAFGTSVSPMTDWHHPNIPYLLLADEAVDMTAPTRVLAEPSCALSGRRESTRRIV